MTSPAAAPVRTRTTWAVDPLHSLVEFSIKHLVVTTVKGRFTAFAGTIVLDEAEPARSAVEAEIDVASVDTGQPQRDDHLRTSDFFEVERYPKITFRSTRVEPLSQDRFRVVGDLTMRGVTREIALDATYNGRTRHPRGYDVAGFTAETTINRDDFGVQFNMALETGGWALGKTVRVLIEIEAIQQESAAAP